MTRAAGAGTSEPKGSRLMPQAVGPQPMRIRCLLEALPSVPPAGIDLVELADQGGELEVARAGVLVAEAVELRARLAGHIVAHDAQRAGGASVDLDLAGALQPIEPDECLGDAASGGEQAMVAQHHGCAVA